MVLFYEPNIKTEAILSEDESHHACKVLRLKTGDTVHVVDGKGSWLTAQIRKIDARKTELDIQNIVNEYNKPKHWIHLAIAPTKNMDRMEWLVEKAVEIGVQEISFVECQKSERKELKTNRIEKIAIAAMKQSKQAYLPTIKPLQKLVVFLNGDFATTNKYVAHVDFQNKLYLQNEPAMGQKTLILIGPEGDFADTEIANITEKGFVKVSLGNTVLRTETAGLVSVNILNSKYL
jgi:16S rRNA (uracil1498-N3)-methyltransferase